MSALHIPDSCGVILLPDCTLFPHGGLPLHIFEPRYRRMLAEALEGSCLFAVARLTGPESADPATCTAPIGTIGLVRASRELDDGTSNLLLHGIIRVRFTGWIDSSYPRAKIEPVLSMFEPQSQAQGALEALRESGFAAAGELSAELRETVRSMILQIDDPCILADVLAQQFLTDPDERQLVLEMEPVAARVAWICDKFGNH